MGSWFCEIPSIWCGALSVHLLHCWIHPKVWFLGWPLSQVQISVAPGMWGSNQLRNLLLSVEDPEGEILLPGSRLVSETPEV